MFEQASQAINKSMCLPKAFPAFVHIDLNIFVNIHRFLDLSLRDQLMWKVNLLLLKFGLTIDICNWKCRGKGN